MRRLVVDQFQMVERNDESVPQQKKNGSSDHCETVSGTLSNGKHMIPKSWAKRHIGRPLDLNYYVLDAERRV